HGGVARALSVGILRQRIRWSHRRPECRLEGARIVGGERRSRALAHRGRQGVQAARGALPIAARPAREVAPRRNIPRADFSRVGRLSFVKDLVLLKRDNSKQESNPPQQSLGRLTKGAPFFFQGFLPSKSKRAVCTADTCSCSSHRAR